MVFNLNPFPCLNLLLACLSSFCLAIVDKLRCLSQIRVEFKLIGTGEWVVVLFFASDIYDESLLEETFRGYTYTGKFLPDSSFGYSFIFFY